MFKFVSMRLGLFIIFIFSLQFGFSQEKLNFFEQDTAFNKKRFFISSGGVILGAGTSLALLSELWYKDYPRSPLHSFNDNNEWLQMDKLGHLTTAYTVGYVGDNILKWSGVDSKKSAWFGGSLGLAYLTGIEILDGLSEEWGFSWGDMAANTTGSGVYIAQELIWKEQRIRPKFSAHLSPYAELRPNILGASTSERLLKDYNGQTYWLSANIASFLNKSTKFPLWLNVAFGYGGEEMIKGDQTNYAILNANRGTYDLYSAYRQYYLSLDIDLTKIKIKNHFLKTLLGTLNYIKIPFPAIEFSNRGVKGYGIYF